jgi:hypothetical protein
VTLPPDRESFTALEVPPEVVARSQPELDDLRLVAADGAEVPFAVDVVRAQAAAFERVSAELVDTRAERKLQTAWIVDLGRPRRFDVIELDVPEQDFAKRLRIESSNDRTTWSLVRDDAGVFDREWSFRVHHTTISFERPYEARYLRFTADDSRSRPLTLRGIGVAQRRSRDAQAWSRPAPLRLLESKQGRSRYAVELPAGFRFETLHLVSDDPGFSRRVRLLARGEHNGAPQESVLGEAILYRLSLADAALAGECLDLPVSQPKLGPGALVLEIEDGDSPPLRSPRAVVSGPSVRLLFVASQVNALALYYGNDVTRPPVYDLESLKGRIGLETRLPQAGLGAEQENALYLRPPPLPAVATQGAALSVSAWRRVRTLPALAREDIYTLTLAPEDLAVLRPDLADVRLVDGDDRQVPYVIASGAAEVRVGLRAAEARPARTHERQMSQHRFQLVDPVSGEPMALPLAALEIDVAEPFFERPALLTAPADGPRHGPRVLFSGTLQRRSGNAAILLALGGPVTSELLLEIDEGDNAPLTVTAPRAFVRVPRIAFKARAGAHRLLLGNAKAQAPRYDIAGLAREVLSYSAVPLSAEPGQDNPAFRRSAADYFKQAPPTLLLWGSLIAAVAGLLLLTIRILKQPAQP